MSEQCPVTITVHEYYTQNFIAKVAKKECKVSVPGYAGSWIEDVEDVRGMYFVKFQDHEGQHSFNFEPDDKLTVYWLPQPEREEAAAPLLPQTVEGAVQKRARHNSRFTIGQQVKHWDQLHESAPDEKPYTVTGKDGVMHDIEEVGSPTNRKTVHEAYIYEIEEREEAAVREFADGWRDAEVARLQAEVARLREALWPIVGTWKEWKSIEWFRDAFDNTDFTEGMFERATTALGDVELEAPDHK